MPGLSRRHLQVSIVASLLLIGLKEVRAQDVLIATTGGRLPQGSGVLFGYRGNCYAATTKHLVAEASDTVSVHVKPGLRIRGFVKMESPTFDIARVDLDKVPAGGCRRWPSDDRVAHVLGAETMGQLRYVDENGVHFVNVHILSSNPDLSIRPVDPAQTLNPGMSGGGIYIRNVLVGILQAAQNGQDEGEAYAAGRIWPELRPDDYGPRSWRIVATTDVGLYSSEWLGPESLGGEDRLTTQRRSASLTVELPTRFLTGVEPRVHAGGGVLQLRSARTGTNAGGTQGNAVYFRSGGDAVYRLFEAAPAVFLSAGAAALWFPQATNFELHSSGTEVVPLAVPAQIMPELSAGVGATLPIAKLALDVGSTVHWLPRTTLERRGVSLHRGILEFGVQAGVHTRR